MKGKVNQEKLFILGFVRVIKRFLFNSWLNFQNLAIWCAFSPTLAAPFIAIFLHEMKKFITCTRVIVFVPESPATHKICKEKRREEKTVKFSCSKVNMCSGMWKIFTPILPLHESTPSSTVAQSILVHTKGKQRSDDSGISKGEQNIQED